MDDFRNKCFFCSETIDGRKSQEHIIPNSLLGKLGMKEETLIGERETQYSRIKVPSHPVCNNEFGSVYEDRVLELLEDTDRLYEILVAEENSIPMLLEPDDSVTSILTTWLSKIYYGLFYHDALRTTDESWRDLCISIIDSENFGFVQRSYANGHGFQLPSSLYAFKTSNTDTDLKTQVIPSGILFKINTITLILCICDGFLTKQYLFGESLEDLRRQVLEIDQNDSEFPSYWLALVEILALRRCIPKTPKFVFSNSKILNMSLSTLVSNPEEFYKIDSECLKAVREEYSNQIYM